MLLSACGGVQGPGPQQPAPVAAPISTPITEQPAPTQAEVVAEPVKPVQTAAFSKFSTANNASQLAQPDVTCNFATGAFTGVGGPGTCIASPTTCNGSTNNTASFNTFASWAINWEAAHPGLLVGLDMTGLSCTLTQHDGVVTFAGIKRLLVLGTGATLSAPSGGWYNHLAGKGQPELNGDVSAARTATVAAGATKVSLLTAGETSRFTVGQYAIMLGYDMQQGGFPANNFYVNYVKIISKDGSCGSTGDVCFDRALTDTFKSTWPLWQSGGASTPNYGGPATLLALDPAWDIEVEWRGVTFAASPGVNKEIDAVGRKAVFRNTTWNDSGGNTCLFPTVNFDLQIINSSMPACQMEFDKLSDTVTITGSTLNDVELQSTGANNLIITNSTIHTLNGSARNNVYTDLTITANWYMGQSQGFGRTDEVVCIRCNVANILDPQGKPGGYVHTFGGAGLNAVSGASMTAGVITIPNSGGASDFRWAVPGTNLFWVNETVSRPTSLAFQVLDVTKDVTNVYITTSLSKTGFSGLIPTAGATKLYVLVHPAPRFTCTSCTGNAWMTSMSLAPARDPIWSYQQFTYTGSIAATAQLQMPLWGNPTQFDYDVTVAYGGGGGLLYVPGTYWTVTKSDNTEANYASPTWGVNAKSVGHRRVTRAGGATCVSGTCTGDSGLAFPDATLSMFRGISTTGPQFSADVSGSCPGAGCPSVTTTMTADQGVVYPYLLKRDLDPAANDNTPMWLNQAA